MKKFNLKSILIFIVSALCIASCTEENELPTAYETVTGAWEICQTYKYNETKSANLTNTVTDDNVFIFDEYGSLYIITDSAVTSSRYTITDNNIAYDFGDGYESSLYRMNGNKIYIYNTLVEDEQTVEIGIVLQRTEDLIGGLTAEELIQLLSTGDYDLSDFLSSSDSESDSSSNSNTGTISDIYGTWISVEENISGGGYNISSDIESSMAVTVTLTDSGSYTVEYMGEIEYDTYEINENELIITRGGEVEEQPTYWKIVDNQLYLYTEDDMGDGTIITSTVIYNKQ